MNERTDQTTVPSPRQEIIAAARIWLLWKCPDNTANQIDLAAVKIANIVLGLRVEAKVDG
jgi:hypothetical protein